MRRSGWWVLASSLLSSSRRKCFFAVLVWLVVGLGAFTPAGRAQATSTIEGSITDHQGLAVAGAEVRLAGDTVGFDKTTVTDGSGNYQLGTVTAGTYKLTVSHSGFGTKAFKSLEITLNRTLRFDVILEITSVKEVVEVYAAPPLLETSSSSERVTITPQQIVDMPINGRNYLDLMQLVPGGAINQQASTNSDNSTPVTRNRANNTGFLIDGLSDQNELNDSAAAQFNQDTIAQFQVLTTPYKAEFGHASGGVVNAITKTCTNDIHGLAPAYHRHNAFDSS